jgi:hypothetical protein
MSGKDVEIVRQVYEGRPVSVRFYRRRSDAIEAAGLSE